MTRLVYERMLRDNFPELIWMRSHTSAPYTITVYACDKDLDLAENTKSELLKFLEHRGMASCKHIIKHYFDIRNDNVFEIGEIPDIVRNLAILGDVTYPGVQNGVLVAFPKLNADSIKVTRNIVSVSPRDGVVLTVFEVDFLERLLAEILPMGSVAKITSRPYAHEQALTQ